MKVRKQATSTVSRLSPCHRSRVTRASPASASSFVVLQRITQTHTVLRSTPSLKNNHLWSSSTPLKPLLSIRMESTVRSKSSTKNRSTKQIEVEEEEERDVETANSESGALTETDMESLAKYMRVVKVSKGEEGQRLDRFLSHRNSDSKKDSDKEDDEEEEVPSNMAKPRGKRPFSRKVKKKERKPSLRMQKLIKEAEEDEEEEDLSGYVPYESGHLRARLKEKEERALKKQQREQQQEDEEREEEEYDEESKEFRVTVEPKKESLISKLSISRATAQRLLKEGKVYVNGNKMDKTSYKVRLGDEVKIVFDEVRVSTAMAEKRKPQPENIPLDILHEDDDIIIVNKPPGLMVHGGPGIYSGTLVNALLYHTRSLSTVGGEDRPGIVHRLDRDTSGLMVIAKNDDAHNFLKEQFASRTIEKMYFTIVVGKPRDNGSPNVINKPIIRHPKDINKMTIAEDGKGKEAITEYKILQTWFQKDSRYSLLQVKIHTGRTHQIRLHLSSIGTPVVGDPIYCRKSSKHRVPYLLLVSKSLQFIHPSTGKTVSFQIPYPKHIKEFIDQLEKDYEKELPPPFKAPAPIVLQLATSDAKTES